jgi:hypothetical protein
MRKLSLGQLVSAQLVADVLIPDLLHGNVSVSFAQDWASGLRHDRRVAFERLD